MQAATMSPKVQARVKCDEPLTDVLGDTVAMHHPG
jgi:hypothetical protein